MRMVKWILLSPIFFAFSAQTLYGQQAKDCQWYETEMPAGSGFRGNAYACGTVDVSGSVAFLPDNKCCQKAFGKHYKGDIGNCTETTHLGNYVGWAKDKYCDPDYKRWWEKLFGL